MNNKDILTKNGFLCLNNIYSNKEIQELINIIENVNSDNETFRKSKEVFAIRQFLKEIPSIIPHIFNNKLNEVIQQYFGKDYFVVKSIYFDKPETSNWFVSYHQDLTISVDNKVDLENFGPWSIKQNQFAVQPPLQILENIYTIRIHLDDTNEENGALKVIPGSHNKQIYRPETIDWNKEIEVSCSVNKGGIMIMRPLLLHSSSKTTNNQRRRVIHIEFSNLELPKEINWSEELRVKS
ncbi:MAG: hypothetical protein RLZZ175_2616 [Bacteroidota bacterium]|jgi:ectoine hydroxylase-related dioxygenase (phytanoyl-CoA dioxygenase family)